MSDSPLIAALKAPFPYACIGWRVGARNGNKGQPLPYLDARDVQNRLDDVMSPENWQVSFSAAPSGGVLCTLSLRINNEWIAKQDGAQQDTSARKSEKEEAQARAMTVKGALSDAFKRAGVMWGIGRYLYAYEGPWLPLKDENQRLAQYPQLPDHMLPENERGGRTGASSVTTPQSAAETGATSTGTLGTTPAGKPLFDSSVAGDAEDPSIDNAPGSREQFQSSVAGDVEDPSAEPKGKAATPGIEVPVVGSADQWSSLTKEDKNTIRILSERIRNKVALVNVESFLTEGKGKTLPEWVRAPLLKNIAEISGTVH